MRRWQRWVDPRVAADDRWHSSRVGVVRSSVLLGDHLVAQLRELARRSVDDMALARCGQFLNKKLRGFERENRVLIRFADSARVILLLQGTIDSVLGMTDQLDSEMRDKWLQNLRQEREEFILEIEKVLKSDDKIEIEMGTDRQQMELLALLRHEMEQYRHILTQKELQLVSDVFDTIVTRGNAVVGNLPKWFATSGLEWFRAKTTVVEGEESCERQATLWAKLHHPNVRKFYGACHVGKPFVIHEACSELPLSKENAPRRSKKKTRGERAMAKKRSERKAREMEKVALTWKHLLGCALGLQYVHERGLVHERLSVANLLFSQASHKGILSGMGLVRQQKNIEWNVQGPGERPSISADTLAFGLAIFQTIVKDRTEENGLPQWLVPDRLPDVRPDFVSKAEWDLVVGMCGPDPVARSCVADVVHIISLLANNNCSGSVHTQSTTPATVDDPSVYEIPSLGMTLKDTLDEIEQLCCEEDNSELGDVNRPVYDRLLDIYKQLLVSPALVSTAFVESFSLVVLRFFDMLDQRSLGPPSHATIVCASRTVAGKNYSFHHDIDMLLRTSNLQSTHRAHHWQTTWKEERGRQDNTLKSYLENPAALLSQLPNNVDRSEAIALLQFEARTQLDVTPDGVCKAAKAVAPQNRCIDGNEELPVWFIPPYQVQLGKHIADGSFGAVYDGEWLDTDVVVKQVLLDPTETENWEQFRREADLWFSLNHPNLVKLYGACHQGRPFFVCERASHGTLASYLKRQSRRKIWHTIGAAALGLQHLHDHNIVHGDIKGNNILVCDGIDGLPTAKLADFGLSFATNRVSAPDDHEHGALGAFRWKAPECLLGGQPTVASDIYSFGMCIIEAITGQYPWGLTMPDSVVVYNVAEKRLLPPRPSRFNDADWHLVSRMCHFEPHRRIPIGAVINCAFNLAIS